MSRQRLHVHPKKAVAHVTGPRARAIEPSSGQAPSGTARIFLDIAGTCRTNLTSPVRSVWQRRSGTGGNDHRAHFHSGALFKASFVASIVMVGVPSLSANRSDLNSTATSR